MELNDLAKHILLRDSTPPKDFNEPMDPEKKKGSLVHKAFRVNRVRGMVAPQGV